MVLLKQVFPCFHCIVKPLLHTYTTYGRNLFFVEGQNGMLLNCHMCQLFIAVNLPLKNTIFIENGVYLSEISECEVSIRYNLIAKGINYLQY